MNAKPLISGAAFEVNSLDALKKEARTNSAVGLRAAAKQIEGIFVQMMLKSMRDASIKDDLMHSQSSDMFTSMYDQQIAQDIAAQGKLGFADMMVRQFGGEVAPPVPTQGAGVAPYQLSPGQQKTWQHIPMRNLADAGTPACSGPPFPQPGKAVFRTSLSLPRRRWSPDGETGR